LLAPLTLQPKGNGHSHGVDRNRTGTLLLP
jgi:hypothetical protein